MKIVTSNHSLPSSFVDTFFFYKPMKPRKDINLYLLENFQVPNINDSKPCSTKEQGQSETNPFEHHWNSMVA